MYKKLSKEKKCVLGKRGGEGERDGARHDDRRATTVTELAEGNSSSLPITCGRWLWMGSTAWEERRRSSTCTKKWVATSLVCRKRGNENGERLLSFSANHELALLNTFFSTAKNAISHTFNGRGIKRIDYILTRQRDTKFVRDVTVHPQPSFLPISDHNIVTAHVKLLGRFARNRPVREAKGPPPIDRRRLMTDPHLRQQVATAIGDHLRAFPPSGSSVDDVETAFTTAILQIAERVAPPGATRLPGRGWRGDTQAEAEISMAMAARRAAWKRQRADPQDKQLMRAVRRENTRVHRVCTDAKNRFLERHAQGMEKDLRQRDQMGLFQRCKFLNIEDTRKVNSQYIRDEEGIMLRDPELVRGRWARFFGTLLNSKSDKLKLDIIEELPQWPITHASNRQKTS